MVFIVAFGPDSDLKFPIFWSEVYIEGTWLPIDSLVLNLIAQTPKEVEQFEPKGKVAEEKKLVMGYVVAYEAGIQPNPTPPSPLCLCGGTDLRSICEGRDGEVCEELPR